MRSTEIMQIFSFTTDKDTEHPLSLWKGSWFLLISLSFTFAKIAGILGMRDGANTANLLYLYLS